MTTPTELYLNAAAEAESLRQRIKDWQEIARKLQASYSEQSLRIAALEAALTFYAEGYSSAYAQDGGETARKALEEKHEL